jgi:hypothetical protein
LNEGTVYASLLRLQQRSWISAEWGTRRQQIRPICQALGEFDTFASPHESPLQALTRAETTQVIRKAIVALPAKYSQVLTNTCI